MVLRKLTGVFSIALVIGAASFAVAGVPDLDNSSAATAVGGGVTPVLYNLPNAQGAPFNAAVFGGVPVDATITLTLLDGNNVPVANFAAADMWLEVTSGTFFGCVGGGTIADFNTNASGQTVWAAPLAAGGWSNGATQVYINGAPLAGSPLALWHNSADITGDGSADLSDIGEFASDYYSVGEPFRSDLSYDGSVDLGDVGVLASGVGAACP